MIRLSIFIVGLVAGALALSSAAFAQQTTPAFAIGEVPSPGTIEDPHAVIKQVADGPPRILPGTVMTGSDKPVMVAVVQPAHG